jgi:aminoglycoside/choline kinase family phosphotransferase
MLRDVRKDISENTVAEIKDLYMRSARTTSNFELQFACLSVQRNLRILGVFAKLIGQQNKKKYVEFLHGTWSNVKRDLDHPEFTKLREIFDSHFPEPTAEYLMQRGFV